MSLHLILRQHLIISLFFEILGSHEQSPRLLESFRYESVEQDIVMGPVESQLREDLADAMKENLGIPVQTNEEPGELLFYKIFYI